MHGGALLKLKFYGIFFGGSDGIVPDVDLSFVEFRRGKGSGNDIYEHETCHYFFF